MFYTVFKLITSFIHFQLKLLYSSKHISCILTKTKEQCNVLLVDIFKWWLILPKRSLAHSENTVTQPVQIHWHVFHDSLSMVVWKMCWLKLSLFWLQLMWLSCLLSWLLHPFHPPLHKISEIRMLSLEHCLASADSPQLSVFGVSSY